MKSPPPNNMGNRSGNITNSLQNTHAPAETQRTILDHAASSGFNQQWRTNRRVYQPVSGTQYGPTRPQGTSQYFNSSNGSNQSQMGYLGFPQEPIPYRFPPNPAAQQPNYQPTHENRYPLYSEYIKQRYLHLTDLERDFFGMLAKTFECYLGIWNRQWSTDPLERQKWSDEFQGTSRTSEVLPEDCYRTPHLNDEERRYLQRQTLMNDIQNGKFPLCSVYLKERDQHISPVERYVILFNCGLFEVFIESKFRLCINKRSSAAAVEVAESFGQLQLQSANLQGGPLNTPLRNVTTYPESTQPASAVPQNLSSMPPPTVYEEEHGLLMREEEDRFIFYLLSNRVAASYAKKPGQHLYKGRLYKCRFHYVDERVDVAAKVTDVSTQQSVLSTSVHTIAKGLFRLHVCFFTEAQRLRDHRGGRPVLKDTYGRNLLMAPMVKGADGRERCAWQTIYLHRQENKVYTTLCKLELQLVPKRMVGEQVDKFDEETLVWRYVWVMHAIAGESE